MTTDTRFGELLARDIQIKTIHDQGLEIARLTKVIEGAKMARTRLERFADEANAGRVHHDARELKRRVWASFADFDAAITSGERAK